MVAVYPETSLFRIETPGKPGRMPAPSLENEIWQSSLEILAHTLRAAHCSLMFLDERSRELVVVKSLSSRIVPGSRFKLQESVPGRAAATGRAVLSGDEEHTGENLISVPIISAGRCRGVLTAIRETDRELFSSFDVATAQLIAENIALHMQNEVVREEIGRLAIMDSLTGLYNRRFFEESLEREVARVKRFWQKLSLIILDVDNFKRINDDFGHPTGDAVLKNMAVILRSVTRQLDIVCRYGGDEFAVLLPETDEAGAMRVGNRITLAMEDFDLNGMLPSSVHLSVGISGYPSPATTKRQLLQQADEAMYLAKRNASRQPVFFDGK